MRLISRSVLIGILSASLGQSAFGQDLPATQTPTGNSAERVVETREAIDIKDLNIPEDSRNIYIIRPPSLPQAIAPTPVPAPTSTGNIDTKTPPANKKRRATPPMLTWENPDVPPRCVLLCVHGLGLYNHSYEDFAKRISNLGVAVCAIDVRGFGSWMESQGHERVDFDGCLADLQATLKVIHKVHPGLPVFLLGESMGGAIALRATAMYPDLVSGLISSVPAGDRFQQKRTELTVALHLLSSPNKPFNVGEGVIKQATVNPELRHAWLSDPLDRLNISAHELLQFQSFMNQNHESAKEITNRPVLIVQGCSDHLVKPEGTIELYNELGTADKELMLIPGQEHLIFEEDQCSNQVLKVVADWLDNHVPPSQAAPVTKAMQ